VLLETTLPKHARRASKMTADGLIKGLEVAEASVERDLFDGKR
jgi:hypothetical protein